ncbi:MAG: hypothetical protein HY459_00825 [Parcubacteria group bacterium]|nr:hypothetical protein [Parcubacteria group bacterium]
MAAKKEKPRRKPQARIRKKRADAKRTPVSTPPSYPASPAKPEPRERITKLTVVGVTMAQTVTHYGIVSRPIGISFRELPYREFHRMLKEALLNRENVTITVTTTTP